MMYVQLRAGGHALLIAADEVAQVTAAPPEAAAVAVLCAAPRVFVCCMDGRVLGVDEARTMVEVADDALLPVPWMPAGGAAELDAFVEAGSAWRLRRGAGVASS